VHRLDVLQPPEAAHLAPGQEGAGPLSASSGQAVVARAFTALATGAVLVRCGGLGTSFSALCFESLPPPHARQCLLALRVSGKRSEGSTFRHLLLSLYIKSSLAPTW
jgi:hypothetical protein